MKRQSILLLQTGVFWIRYIGVVHMNSKSNTVALFSLILFSLFNCVCLGDSEGTTTKMHMFNTLTFDNKSFTIELKDGTERVGTVNANIALNGPEEFLIGQESTVSMILDMGNVKKFSKEYSGSLNIGEKLEKVTTGKASDLIWTIESGHVSFAYDDATGQCLGPVRMYIYEVNKEMGQWVEMKPPSRDVQAFNQILTSSIQILIGLSPAGLIISTLEEIEKCQKALFGEREDVGLWVENNYDIISAPAYSFGNLNYLSSRPRKISKLRFDLPIRFVKTPEIPLLHGALQIKLQALKDWDLRYSKESITLQGEMLEALQSQCNFTIVRANRPPLLASIGDKSVEENSTLIFNVNATDPDGDTVTYSAGTLPSGAAFTGQTFTWTPSYDKAGSYQVTFIASDGQLQDSETITITVNNVNRPPVVGAITDPSVDENTLLSIPVNATDPDGQTIAYSVSGLPAGAVFASQTLTWTPSQGQMGSYDVTFIASDGQLQDSETITITVNNVNRAPVLGTISG